MKKLSILFIAAAVLFAPAAAGGSAQDHLIAVKAKQIITVSGKPIDNGTILIKNGKIMEVGPSHSITVPPGYKTYEYGDHIVYPGLINAMTTLGIIGISSIRQWNDSREIGKFNPHISAFTAFYPWSNLIPITRDFGTLIALSAPSRGLISGKAVLYSLAGWAPEDMFIRKEAAMVMEIPELPTRIRDEKQKKTLKEKAEKEKKELREFIDRAHKYYLRSQSGKESSSIPLLDDEVNPRYEAMKALWTENLPVILSADDEENIKYALKLGKDFKLNVILYGAYDGETLLKEIKASGYPVILGSMYGRNKKWEDGCDKVFRLPALLAREGILFAFSASSWGGTAFDLPIHAGRAAGYGLSQEDALKGLTLYPAGILGLEEYGSIEKGKIANLVIAGGNILETSTIVKDVFVKGKKITAKSFFDKEFRKAKHKISGEFE